VCEVGERDLMGTVWFFFFFFLRNVLKFIFIIFKIYFYIKNIKKINFQQK
jgi:hypothetical protein